MIDNLLYQIQQLKTYDCTRFSTYSLKGNANGYIFLTLHRPSNVDSRETFEGIAAALNHIAEDTPIFFPVHPRTKKMMGQFDIKLSENIKRLPPLGFKESLFCGRMRRL